MNPNSDPKLTANIYTHVMIEDKADELAKLPEIAARRPADEIAVKTGTDGTHITVTLINGHLEKTGLPVTSNGGTTTGKTMDTSRDTFALDSDGRIWSCMESEKDRLDLNTTHCISAAECDVCRLARASKRIVLSAYAEEYTDFIRATRETPDGMTVRVDRDFGADFRRYIVRSGLPEYAKGYKLMARAEMVSQHLVTAERAPESQPITEEQATECRVVDAQPSPAGGYIQNMTERPQSRHIRIIMRGGPQLRIVR